MPTPWPSCRPERAWSLRPARAWSTPEAVAAALKDGRLAGAAFDVFETHPVRPDHPLLSAPNAILLPHIGGATDVTVTRHSEMIVDDYLRFLAGEPLVNPVPPTVGP